MLPAFIPTIAIIATAIASFVSVAVTTIQSKITPQPSPLVSMQTEQPTPTPTPTPTPSPTPNPSPGPSPSAVASPSPKPAAASGSSSSAGNATVLSYDLSSTTVVTDTGNDNDCSNECPTKPLALYIAENGGRAGMNGTYFCPPDYANCAGKINSFDFPVWNNRQKKWINASTLFWNGRGMMVFRSGSAQFFPNSAAVGAPSDITGGIVNYPSLLSGGNILVANDGTKGTRSGIGFGSGKLFLVIAGSANYYDLANTFKSLGATEALNLDGGGSVALFDGGYKVGPGRNLPNAVIIK